MKKVVIIFIVLIIIVGAGAYLLGKKSSEKNPEVAVQMTPVGVEPSTLLEQIDKKIACNYQYQEAQYFLASTTNFLLIDQGTAPDPRTIIVYDLNKCEKVYEGQYSKPFSLAGNKATYWEPTSEEITDKNCPEHQGYEKNGLGAGIEGRIVLDLSSLAKTTLDESRCRARQ